MPKLNIDGQDIEVADGLTLLQACEEAGAEIPRFCYHERLSIAGNCRMCLVEVEGAPKPVASCAFGVNDLRPGPEGQPPVIKTKSPLVKKARNGVMEFLLINHPLDCPICDQGGECDLQDQAMAFGLDDSRFCENKNALEAKDFGPLIRTYMTRCIQCTRCVRFSAEIAGAEELGNIGRGENSEITPYLKGAVSSELSGNLIDICPVGALTSAPFAFSARSWELKKTETIDVMDAVGSNIRVDSRGSEVMRIMPRLNDDINEVWISDKTRFIWDGLKNQRLDRPYIRVNGKLKEASWDEAFSVIKGKISRTPAEKIAAIVGDLAAAEEIFALKELMLSIGTPNIDCRQDGSRLGEKGGRAAYLFNATIAGIEEADAILLVGCNPRVEASLLNARIRKNWLNKGTSIALIGEKANLNYDYHYLGGELAELEKICAGRGDFFATLDKAEKPLVIIGQGALGANICQNVLATAYKVSEKIGAIKDGWNGFSILHDAASRVAGLDIGFLPQNGGLTTEQIISSSAKGGIEVLYLLGADEIDMSELGNSFVIYQGSHGDAGAHRADVILPGAAYTEKSGTYVNTEGRVQLTQMAIFPPGQAKEDWTIIRAISEILGHKLSYNNIGQLRAAMYNLFPHFANIGSIDMLDINILADIVNVDSEFAKKHIADFVPKSSVEDFYFTNSITRASKVMAKCSSLAKASAG